MACISSLEGLREFDPAKLTFSPLKKPEAGLTNASARPARAQVRYNGMPLRIQTPLMYLPFKYDGESNSTGLTFCTRCDGEDATYATEFIRVMHAVQNFAYASAADNSQEWFNKSKLSFEEGDDFTFALREHPESKYPPHLKLKYYRDDAGRPQFPIYDGETSAIVHSRSAPGSVDLSSVFAMNTRHRVIIDCMGIWSLNKRGGITWRMNDVLMYKPTQSVFPFANAKIPDDLCVQEAYVAAPYVDESFQRSESCLQSGDLLHELDVSIEA